MSGPDSTSLISDSDLEQCLANLKTVKKRIDALETSMQNIIASAVKMPSALEVAGHKYVELTATATVRRRGEGCSTRHRGTTTPSGAVHNTAKQFTSLMGALRDGDILTEYRAQMYKNVMEPLQPIREAAKKAVEAGKAAKSALKVYKKKSNIVEKKLNKYTRKNKSIGESKKFNVQLESRERAKGKWQNKCKNFMDMHENLMLNMERVGGETMDYFLEINARMLQHMIDAARQISPLHSHLSASKNINNNINNTSINTLNEEERAREPITPIPGLAESPPTLTSRLQYENDENDENERNEERHIFDSIHKSQHSSEPFALQTEATAPTNFDLLNYTQVASGSARLNESYENPLTKVTLTPIQEKEEEKHEEKEEEKHEEKEKEREKEEKQNEPASRSVSENNDAIVVEIDDSHMKRMTMVA